MVFRRKGDKAHYNFLDKTCLGRSCWAAGMYQHRSPMSCGGSRNTGSPDSPCCLSRAYRGCPIPLPDFQPDLARERAKDGWRLV